MTERDDERRGRGRAARSGLCAATIAAAVAWGAIAAAGPDASPAPVLRLAEAPEQAPLPPVSPRADDSDPETAAPAASPIPERVEARSRARWVRARKRDESGAAGTGPSGSASLAAPEPVPRPERWAAPPPIRPDPSGRGSASQLPLESAALIGVMTLSSGRTALLRLSSGAIHRLSVGDTIEGWRVSAITNDALRLTRQGEHRTFLLLRR